MSEVAKSVAERVELFHIRREKEKTLKPLERKLFDCCEEARPEDFNQILTEIFGEDLESVKIFFDFTDEELYNYIFRKEEKDVKPLCQMLKFWGNVKQIFLDCRNLEAFVREKEEFTTRMEILICRRIPELILSETTTHLIFNHSVLKHEFGSYFIRVDEENSWTGIPVSFLNREKLRKAQVSVFARKKDVPEGEDWKNMFYEYQDLDAKAEMLWKEFDAKND